MDIVISSAGDGWEARFGDHRWRCAVGRGGIGEKRGEGDHISPEGCWPIRRILYRPDRVAAPPAPHLHCIAIAPGDGWCDAPDHPEYNRPVRLPFPESHETLWREDALYDIVGVLGFNDDPVVAGAGSAIFIHVASPGYGPTEGCAALARDDLLELLSRIDGDTRLCFRKAD
ncbi:L,D-transpeptidase-like protein [Rhodovulum visakhapatnamense]|uniref:L,D-transpeptidase-like protein n=2 Tax=Rhodovulum visakhapatnamense TaxID=364297 RepID=A0A4R8FZU1_9RHOB|nr:L,D-transpeptidase-like protein [Rhodovulum visakhapatnamense]